MRIPSLITLTLLIIFASSVTTSNAYGGSPVGWGRNDYGQASPPAKIAEIWYIHV